ncbi:MAG TPA: endonuclease domain-containing protein [Kofleriaceae bacterium]|nr:endonuclease domain-containing protein [Kofleriaceae bacterium]
MRVAPKLPPPLRGRVGEGAGATIVRSACSPPRLRKQIQYARNMRKQPTRAERILWRVLRRRQLGVYFRRQHPVAGYILDFYCSEAKLAIELDGGGHALPEQQRYDARRAAVLAANGITSIRLWNPQIVHETRAVLELIEHHLRGGAACG